MKRNLRRIMAGVFIAACAVFIAAFNASRPKVLVLHSYDETYAWTRDVSVGLRRVLDARPLYSQRWYYMDTKRHPSPEFRQNAGNAARRVIDSWRPDIIIAIDDDAQKYAASHYVGHPRIRIVFSGVNGEVTPYGYDGASNVTGIFERKQMQGIKEVALAIGGAREPIRVMHLGDTSESVKKDDKFIQGFDWLPLEYAGTRLVDTFDDWKAAVQDAAGATDVLITTNYRRLARSATDKALVNPAEVVAWTEANARVPVIGTNGFYVEDGGMLAIGTSPYEQGEVAGRMAVAIIEKGITPSSIPYASTRQYVVFMRQSQLQARNIVLPRVYEAFARAANTYFE